MGLKESKTYGETALKDIENQHSRITRDEGESVESLAARLYYAQMDVYSAYAGGDLAKSFDELPEKIRQGWIKKARKHGK